MPRFKAYLLIPIFLGAAYFGYRYSDNSTTTHLTPQEGKPPTSKPWPWPERRQSPQMKLDNIQPKSPGTLDTTIPFSHTFPDFYAKFKESPVDDLGQDWDDSNNDETFTKHAPEPNDLQIEPLTDLGQNWDD